MEYNYYTDKKDVIISDQSEILWCVIKPERLQNKWSRNNKKNGEFRRISFIHQLKKV